jgi:hypothetical protein
MRGCAYELGLFVRTTTYKRPDKACDSLYRLRIDSIAFEYQESFQDV